MSGEPGVSGGQCPNGEFTRGQAVFLQGCYGQSTNGAVIWTSQCPQPPSSNDPPTSTFGLPCEQLLNESSDSYIGPYVPFYSGAKQATYAPNSTGAFNFWTPACYLSP